MKKIVCFLLAAIAFGACVNYKPVAKYLDTQKLPQMAFAADTSSTVKVQVEKSKSVSGIPEKGTLAEKSQYVIPLPFVGFFGGKLLMKPGEPTIDPLFDNLQASLQHDIATSYPKDLKNNYLLKVKVDSSSFAFRYRRKGFMIWIFIIQFGSKKEYCEPTDISLSVSYELLNNGVLVKKGAVTDTIHNEQKIFSNTPAPQARPYDPNNLGDSPSNAAVRSQDAFALGGIGGTVSNGLVHALIDYDDLIARVSKKVIAETKDSVH